jgi:hypothetical protein
MSPRIAAHVAGASLTLIIAAGGFVLIVWLAGHSS